MNEWFEEVDQSLHEQGGCDDVLRRLIVYCGVLSVMAAE